MNFIGLLDIFASIGTVVTIALVGKYPKLWLLYSFASVAFTIVCSSKGLIGLTTMGVILTILGIRNYRMIGVNKK